MVNPALRLGDVVNPAFLPSGAVLRGLALLVCRLLRS